MIKCWTDAAEEKKDLLALSLQVWPLPHGQGGMAEGTEEADHISSVVRKQKGMNVGAQLTFSHPFPPTPPPLPRRESTLEVSKALSSQSLLPVTYFSWQSFISSNWGPRVQNLSLCMCAGAFLIQATMLMAVGRPLLR